MLLVRTAPVPVDLARERYHADSDFFYLTGLQVPGAVLALLPPGNRSGKREILFVPGPGDEGPPWTDPLPSVQSQKRSSGIASIEPLDKLWELLASSLRACPSVYVSGSGWQDAGPDRENVVSRVRALHGKAEVRDAASLMGSLRRVKSPAERRWLKRAAEVTTEAIRAARRRIRPGSTEMEVEGAVLAAFRRAGAPAEAFTPIIGSGPNGLILHHDPTPRRMRPGETVVVDIGAEVGRYCGDVSRTFPVSGSFTPRQWEVYRLLERVQRACERAVKPGRTSLEELNNLANNLLRKSPLRARDADGELRTMDAFMPHSIGHFLGLDTHDPKGGSDRLDPGVVFTIEPGVYLPFEGFGMRIEDDYLVTARGVEKLSGSSLARMERRDSRAPARRRHSVAWVNSPRRQASGGGDSRRSALCAPRSR